MLKKISTLSDEDKQQRLRTAIVLVHGIGGNRLVMWPLAKRLRKIGYEVDNWGYPSWFTDIRRHGKKLADRLQAIHEDQTVDRICLVGHSMGSIVARAALSEFNGDRPSKIRSAVLLTPPNTGTPTADLFAPLFGWLSKPATQLSTAPDSFVNSLPRDHGIPTGVIAWRDWTIPLQHTHLPSQTAHTIVGGIHSMIVMRKDVVQLIDSFIQSHSFAEATKSETSEIVT